MARIENVAKLKETERFCLFCLFCQVLEVKGMEKEKLLGPTVKHQYRIKKILEGIAAGKKLGEIARELKVNSKTVTRDIVRWKSENP
jgi:hypothetical protein